MSLLASPSTMSHRVSTLILSLSLLSITGQTQAQSRAKLSDVDDRLLRVERVLDQSLLNLLQQIEGLQGEVRLLRGEVESLNNELATIQKRNRDLYKDTDGRLIDLEAVGSSAQLPDIEDELAEEPLETPVDVDLPVFVAEEPIIPQPRGNASADGPVPPVAPIAANTRACLLYTSPSPRDKRQSRMPSSA